MLVCWLFDWLVCGFGWVGKLCGLVGWLVGRVAGGWVGWLVGWWGRWEVG